jgi:hypothetical protein
MSNPVKEKAIIVRKQKIYIWNQERTSRDEKNLKQKIPCMELTTD